MLNKVDRNVVRWRRANLNLQNSYFCVDFAYSSCILFQVSFHGTYSGLLFACMLLRLWFYGMLALCSICLALNACWEKQTKWEAL